MVASRNFWVAAARLKRTGFASIFAAGFFFALGTSLLYSIYFNAIVSITLHLAVQKDQPALLIEDRVWVEEKFQHE